MKTKGIFQSNQALTEIFQRFMDVIFIVLSLYMSTLISNDYWTAEHTTIAAITAFLYHVTADFNNLYISWRGQPLYSEIKKIILHWFFSISVVYLAVIFFTPQFFADQYIKPLWFFLGITCLLVYRILLRYILSFFRAKGYNARSFVIAGAGDLGNHLRTKINDASSIGLIFNGFYDDNKINGISGNLIDLVNNCKLGGVDRVYITLPMRAEQRIKWLTKELADSTVSVYLVPDIFMFDILHSRSDVISGIPTISIYDSPLDGSNAVVKRLEDILLSFLIIILISPILLILAIAIKLTSPGPVLFKQNRYGIDGKPIKVWKFRSMKVMEDGAKVTQATKNDSRLTRIGSFIRGTSLDELPQFLNVITGQMSIVGPRPHAIAHNEEYRKLIEGYMLRHKVKPGITGWAQVNGWRGETDTLDKMEKRIEFDLEYIRNWSLLFDLKIIFLTIFKGFLNKNAY